MNERWLPVVGFEGFYEVSDLGRIRSLTVNGRWGLRRRSRPWLRAARSTHDGYRTVALIVEGVRTEHRVHLLVLTAFVGPCPFGMQGAHGDGDPANNVLANLRWATPAENIRDREVHGRTARGARQGLAKLTDEAVRDIRSSPLTSAALAAKYGVNPTAIGFARRGVTWKHVR